MGYLCFIIGVIVGGGIMAFFCGASINEEILKAYERGRADMKAALTEAVEKKDSTQMNSEDE